MALLTPCVMSATYLKRFIFDDFLIELQNQNQLQLHRNCAMKFIEDNWDNWRDARLLCQPYGLSCANPTILEKLADSSRLSGSRQSHSK